MSVTECQLDELWSFVLTSEAHLVMAKRVCESHGDAWIWMAFAPGWRMVLAFVVGKRIQENANLLLQRVAHVTDQGIPFFTSDPLPEYRTVLLQSLQAVGSIAAQRASRAFPPAPSAPAS